jgi:hypothetical protein
VRHDDRQEIADMHGSFDRRASRKAQDATSSSTITFAATPKARRSSKPKKALGPMSEPARLRILDWFLHQVGARTAERPPSYLAVASAFMMHFNDSNGTAFPSLTTLAALCGISKSMVVKVIDLHLADGNIRVVDQAAARRRGRGAQARRLARRSPQARGKCDVDAPFELIGTGSIKYHPRYLFRPLKGPVSDLNLPLREEEEASKRC